MFIQLKEKDIHLLEDKKGIYHGVSSFNYKEGILEEKSHLKSWSSIISSQVKKIWRKTRILSLLLLL